MAKIKEKKNSGLTLVHKIGYGMGKPNMAKLIATTLTNKAVGE